MDSEDRTFEATSTPAGRRSGTRFRQWFAVIAIPVIAVLLLLPLVRQAKEAAWRSQSKNNLKQIGLALHNYHDVYKVFPPSAIVDEDGKLYHGWMYSIIPFIDCNSLYNQIDSNYPWNDERNVEHYKLAIPVYLNPAIAETHCEDGFGYAHYAGSSRIFKPNGSLSFGDITDGAGETLMVGEINEGFKAWGTPANVRDPALGLNNGPNTFGSPFHGGVQFLLADGSVRFIPNEIDPRILKALATPAAGDSVGDDRN